MEAKQIIWTRRASIQLESAQSYIAADNPAAADDFLDEILDSVELLLRHPEFGRMIPEYQNPVFRERIVGHYRLMYTFEEETIRVLALFYDTQQLPDNL